MTIQFSQFPPWGGAPAWVSAQAVKKNEQKCVTPDLPHCPEAAPPPTPPAKDCLGPTLGKIWDTLGPPGAPQGGPGESSRAPKIVPEVPRGPVGGLLAPAYSKRQVSSDNTKVATTHILGIGRWEEGRLRHPLYSGCRNLLPPKT